MNTLKRTKPAKPTAKPKRMSKRTLDKSADEEATRVGAAIRRLRRERRIKQAELAMLVGMQPAQLCNCEKGKNLPSLRTLSKICEALGVTVNDLIYPRNFAATTAAAAAGTGVEKKEKAKPTTPYDALSAKGIVCTSEINKHSKSLRGEAFTVIKSRIEDYLALESMCGIFKHPAIPLAIPFTVDEAGAERLAALVRQHCGIGGAVAFDYIRMLENNGIRILFMNLPGEMESISFYDVHNVNAFIIVSNAIKPEQQLFRTMFELANVYLFTRYEYAIVHETDANTLFSRRFAAVMLMPQEAVLTTVAQLGILPEMWNYDLLVRIKARFGVSAESFLYRLAELKCLPRDTSLLESLLAQINKHYEATSHSGSGGTCSETSRNTRFYDLLITAKLYSENVGEVKKIEDRVFGSSIEKKLSAKSKPSAARKPK